MSLLEKLDQKFLTSAASYIKVLSQYKADDSTLFCLVEGVEDISFYRQFLERYIENRIKYIVCNGKKNVIDNYKGLDWNFFDKKRILFFIDKDFDDFIGEEIIIDENIFITDVYSIENYLVDTITLEKFIVDNCLIIHEDVIEVAKENFKIQHKEYVKQLKMISAWMMYCRKNKFDVNFNQIKMSDLFKIDENGILQKKKLGSFVSKFDYLCNKTDSNHFNLDEIREFYKLIDLESKPQKFIRGKYELHFMFMYLKYISEHLIKEVSIDVKSHNRNVRDKKDLVVRPKLTIQINEENIFQVLNNKAKTPDKLRSFIETL